MASPQDTPSNDETTLTGKQQAFVLAYVSNGFNATQAALTAGYSEKTAYSIGSENLKKPDIKQAIESFLEENTMSAKEVLFRLTQHARGDIGDIWDESTGQVDWDKARASQKTGLIKTIYHKTTRITRSNDEDMEIMEDQITLHDPQKAMTLIGKQLGLFVDRSETKVSGELTVKSYKGFTPDEWDADDSPDAS
jgi:phage terminase small subunit